MKRRLFTVESSAILEGRGIVLFPGLPSHEMLHGAVHVELRFPDETSLVVRVAAMAHFNKRLEDPTPLLIARKPPDLAVPNGTEVWAL